MDITGVMSGILRGLALVGVIRGILGMKIMGMPIMVIPIPIRTMRTRITATAGIEMELIVEATDTTAQGADTMKGYRTMLLRPRGTTTRIEVIRANSVTSSENWQQSVIRNNLRDHGRV